MLLGKQALACVLSLLAGVVLAENSEVCNCGSGSRGCKIENDKKVCECDFNYRQENGVCKAFCEENWQCKNGGKCKKQSCRCMIGTSGDFCETVDACDGIKGPDMCGDPKEVLCAYNPRTERAHCVCRIFEYMYFPKERTCIECDCGKLGNCWLLDGKKNCECNEGSVVGKSNYYGVITDRCHECKCGNSSIGCSYDYRSGLTCLCPKGFAPITDLGGGYSCHECDCGSHGQCYFDRLYRYCNCSEGYSSFLSRDKTEQTCKACDCGVNGTCFFENEVKQCSCNEGYALQDEMCSDIDECSLSTSCPNTTSCLNTIGSYECVCKDGHVLKSPGSDPKVDGCQDVDECENEDLCPRNHTVCHNLPGSYSCTCETGYVPVILHNSLKTAGCELMKPEKQMVQKEESSLWRIGFIILCVAMGIFILSTLTVLCIKRKSTRDSYHRPDSQCQNAKEKYPVSLELH